jgi:hypothetical protein
VAGFSEELTRHEDIDLTWKVLISGAALFFSKEASTYPIEYHTPAQVIVAGYEVGYYLPELQYKWRKVLRVSRARIVFSTLGQFLVTGGRQLFRKKRAPIRAIFLRLLGPLCHILGYLVNLHRLFVGHPRLTAQDLESLTARNDHKPIFFSEDLSFSPNVRFMSLNDELIAVDLMKAELLTLNRSALSVILNAMRGISSIRENAERIAEEFGIDPGNAYDDLLELSADLVYRGVLVRRT